MAYSPTKVKVTTNDLEFIFNYTLWNNLTELDLSEIEGNIVIPEEILSNGGPLRQENEDCVIYVSAAVKANYADYDFIQVKP